MVSKQTMVTKANWPPVALGSRNNHTPMGDHRSSKYRNNKSVLLWKTSRVWVVTLAPSRKHCLLHYSWWCSFPFWPVPSWWATSMRAAGIMTRNSRKKTQARKMRNIFPRFNSLNIRPTVRFLPVGRNACTSTQLSKAWTTSMKSKAFQTQSWLRKNNLNNT